MFLIFVLLYLAQAQSDCVQSDIASNICVNTGIDPRIVIPDGNQGEENCPPGYVECQARCGVSTVSPPTQFGQSVQGQHPWLAYLEINGVYRGAGVLIDNRHVLTAAHKIFLVPLPAINVIMGVYNPRVPESSRQRLQVAGIAQYIPPNLFNNVTLKDDIAIITLATPVVYNRFVLPACRPTQFSPAQINQNCTVAGWGESSFGANDAPTIQKHVIVPIVAWPICIQAFISRGVNTTLYVDQQNELCAGGKLLEDACTYDGGAPLMCSVDGALVATGIVIWGKGCGTPQVYGVYVNVGNYLQWIDNQVRT